MKEFLLARRGQIYSVTSTAELERRLATGDWQLVMPAAKSNRATAMRRLRQERRAAGWLKMDLWLPPEVVAAIHAAQHPGESYLELLVRLLEQGSIYEKPKSHRHK